MFNVGQAADEILMCCENEGGDGLLRAWRLPLCSLSGTRSCGRATSNYATCWPTAPRSSRSTSRSWRRERWVERKKKKILFPFFLLSRSHIFHCQVACSWYVDAVQYAFNLNVLGAHFPQIWKVTPEYLHSAETGAKLLLLFPLCTLIQMQLIWNSPLLIVIIAWKKQGCRFTKYKWLTKAKLFFWFCCFFL